MPDASQPRNQRRAVLDGLLHRPDALIAALESDGIRVAIPDSLAVVELRRLLVPVDRATVLDLVEPCDALVAVGAWERAREDGVAHTLVHARNDPDRSLTLTFVDVRDIHGVWIAALSDPTSDALGVSDSALAGSLAIPLRPRTATMRKSALAVISDIDDRTTRMLGWTAAQMVGVRSTEFLHPSDQERGVANWLEMLSKQESMRVRLRHRCADGSWLWVELENAYLPAEDPSDAVIITQLSDISDEMAMHEALDRRERLLQRLAESLPIGLCQLTSDRTLVYANSRLPSMMGVPAATTLDELLAPVIESDRPALEAALTQALSGGFDCELEVRIELPPSGELRICSLNLVSLSDREGAPGALISLTDITESARMREELTAKATFDVLTGCHNRASIIAMLDQTLLHSDGLLTAVVFVDLDKFKTVNDTFGHGAGDELLVHAANRLTSVLRRDDAVGRIGGDEFLLVSRGLESTEAAMALAARVRKALQHCVTLSTGSVELRASIGVACCEPGIDSATLTRRADQAMYESKLQGHGCPVLYAPL